MMRIQKFWTGSWLATVASAMACLCMGTAIAQPPIPTYGVKFTSTPPTLDGNINDAAWGATAYTGNFTLLTTPGDPAPDEHQFKLLYDATGLYFAYRTTRDLPPDPGPGPHGIVFGAETMNLYIDPNRDNEENEPPGNNQAQYDNVDAYQIAFNQHEANLSCGGLPGIDDDCTIGATTGPTFGTFVEAHVNQLWGNNANWIGMRETIIHQRGNNATESTIEMKIPWSEFDAEDDILNPTGLNATTMPVPGEQWFLDVGQWNGDNGATGGTLRAVWAWHSGGPFAARPDGVITFLAPGVDGDFDNNGLYNCADIDALTNAVASGGSVANFDLNGDSMLSILDVDAWRAEAGDANNVGTSQVYKVGDANLDGVVDGTDFGLWNSNKFTNNKDWCKGNFNADGVTDGSDFGLWNSNKFTASDGSVVPEPVSFVSLGFVIAGCALLRRR
jgi:hypothetical protein